MTATTYQYRVASVQDLEAIRFLTQVAYGQFSDILSGENKMAWSESLGAVATYEKLLTIASCVVCMRGNTIVGSAFLIPSGNPTQWFEKDWAYIRLVAVHPEESGRGIGKELTQRCISMAQTNGEKVLALHTSEFQHAARHMYEGLGFQKLRDLEPIFGKQYYLYTLPLTN